MNPKPQRDYKPLVAQMTGAKSHYYRTYHSTSYEKTTGKVAGKNTEAAVISFFKLKTQTIP